MSFELIKSASKAAGVYRLARWVNRRVWNREELRAYEADCQFYSQFVRAGDLCFDIGANYGAKAEVFLALGARVVALEPQDYCMSELKARLGAQPRLVTVEAAVSDRTGSRTLYVERHSTASSLVPQWQGEIVKTADVSTVTLADAIARYGAPQFIKVDVEGHEFEVLGGLKTPVRYLSFEYHVRGNGVERALACLEHLATLGSVRVNISPAETPALNRPQWWSKQDFVDFFSNEVPRLPEYSYGDVFVGYEPL